MIEPNLIQIAEGLLRLRNLQTLSIKSIAKAINETEPTVNEYIRLLEFDYPTQELLRTGQLEFKHARLLQKTAPHCAWDELAKVAITMPFMEFAKHIHKIYGP